MPWIDNSGTRQEIPADCRSFDFQSDSLDQLESAPAVKFVFVDYGDGKPFSWSTKLRKRGYTGKILASGSLGLDRIFYAFRCGFNLVWLEDSEFDQLTSLHLQPFDHNYQPTVGDQLPRGTLITDDC